MAETSIWSAFVCLPNILGLSWIGRITWEVLFERELPFHISRAATSVILLASNAGAARPTFSQHLLRLLALLKLMILSVEQQ
jgi:hypothetical protein